MPLFLLAEFVGAFPYSNVTLYIKFYPSLMKDRIQAIMEAKGMAQNVFAQTLGLSPATISSIFTGRTNPTNNHVQAIHRAFPEINTNWLLFGEGEMYVEGTHESELPISAEIEQNPMNGGGEPSTLSPSSWGGEEALSLFPEMGGPAAPSPGRAHTSSVSAAPLPSPAELQAAMLAQLAKMNNSDKVERKIKEIRVFYNDGTFEAFSPLVK